MRYYQDLPPIIANKFSVTFSDSTIDGIFTTNTTASGTIHLAINQPGCQGSLDATWTAQKQ
jgi:hypothetical protein